MNIVIFYAICFIGTCLVAYKAQTVFGHIMGMTGVTTFAIVSCFDFPQVPGKYLPVYILFLISGSAFGKKLKNKLVNQTE